MALSDPQSVKVQGSAVSLPRVSTGNFQSEYLSADGTVSLKVSTQNGKRKRQVVRVDRSKITADPFDTSQNISVSQSIYLVVDRPLAGFTNEEALKDIEGFIELLNASTFAVTKKVLASES